MVELGAVSVSSDRLTMILGLTGGFGCGKSTAAKLFAEWGFRQRDKALKGMHYFDAVLKRQPFVAGEAFSMADITVIAGLIFAGLVKLPVPAECVAIQAWYARMLERPSVKNRVTMSEPHGSREH